MKRADLWAGEMVGVDVDGTAVLLVDIDRVVYAYEDRCAHQGVQLSQGCLVESKLYCTAHGWSYDACSGCGLNPENVRLKRYHVSVDGDDIYVDVEQAIAAEGRV
jgi:toluene monooxygenase system ferredoxin subunit